MAVGWRKDYTRYQRYFLNLFAVYKNRDDVKAFLEIVLSLATITFFVIFALRPTVVTITQILKDIGTKEETLQTLKRKTDDLNAAQTIYNQEIDRVLFLSDSIPTNAQVEDYMRQIIALAVKDSVALTNLKIEETVLKGNGGPVQKSKNEELSDLPGGSQGFTFSTTASGAYTNLLSFLGDIESLRRPIWIDESVLSLSETTAGKIISVSVKGRVAYEKKD